MIFTLDRGLRSDEFLRTLQSQGIKAGSMGDSTIRFVMHLDIGDAQLNVLIDKLHQITTSFPAPMATR